MKNWFLKIWNEKINPHLPDILIYGGIGGMAAGAVLACVATAKAVPVIEEHKKTIAEAGEDKIKARKAYRQTAGKLIKTYIFPFAVEAASGFSIVAGNGIHKKRYAEVVEAKKALAASVAMLMAASEGYRDRVKEKYGEDVDLQLSTGGHEEVIEETVTDEKGKTKKVKKTVTVVDNPQDYDYSRYFGPGYTKAAEPNLHYREMFLEGIVSGLEQKLKTVHIVLLNELYQALGYPMTIAGQKVGWIYDPDKDGIGDNHIKLRPKLVYVKNELGEYDPVFHIDPNVDGPVLDRAVEMGLMDP